MYNLPVILDQECFKEFLDQVKRTPVGEHPSDYELPSDKLPFRENSYNGFRWSSCNDWSYWDALSDGEAKLEPWVTETIRVWDSEFFDYQLNLAAAHFVYEFNTGEEPPF